MNKKLIQLFLFLFLPISVFSTHFVGGDVNVQWISGNDYRVTLKLFRDCSATFDFNSSEPIEIYERSTNTYIGNVTVSLNSVEELKLGDECYAPPSSVCIEEYIYKGTVTLNNLSGGYYLSWQSCCRSDLGLNIQDPLSTGFLLYAQVPDPALRNSSPRFNNYPTDGYFCVNTLSYFNFEVTDNDGDSLSYSLITPLDDGSSTPPFQQAVWEPPYSLNDIVGGSPVMSIDPVTGDITASPTQTGAFTFAVKVEEYRNGTKIGEVIRDVMFFSVDCIQKVASVNQTPTGDDTALEGCIDARFIFSLDQSLSRDTTICYEIKGSAVNGVDYAFLDDCITIPAGQTDATIIIDAYADGLTEGQEDIYLIYNPIPCVDFVTDTVFLYIDDNDGIDFTLTGTDLLCNGDNSGVIDVDITGGLSPYDITLTTDSGNGTSTSYTDSDLPIGGLAAGTYLVEVDDIYGCAGAAEPIAASWDAGATFLPDGDGNVYTTTLNVSGISNTTMTDPDEIQQVCLNMEHSFLGDLEMKLIAPDGTELILKERFNANDGNSCDLGEPVAKAPKDGGSTNTDQGTGWEYCFTPTPDYLTMVEESDNYTRNYTDPLGRTYNDNYLPSGAYTSYEPFSDLVGVPLNGDWTIWVMDHLPQDNGWIFSWNIVFKSGGSPGEIITLEEPNPIDITLAGGITQASCNGSDGAIDIDVTGDFPSFGFQWDDPASSTTEDISGLAAGTYTVEVTDQNGCTNSAPFDVSNATGPSLSAIVEDEQCYASNDGSIDLTTSTAGSITSISWSNGEVTEDISGLAPGNYTVEVTDDSGCITVTTYTVNPAESISIVGNIINENCGDKEGEIDISVSGGAVNHSLSWSNGETSEDITDLEQGTYTVTVTDDNGCVASADFDVINEVGQCTPRCDLAINSTTIVDELCGDATGSITLSIFTSNTPHTVSWDNGMDGDLISGLSAGDYTAAITDIEGCELIVTYTINNDSGDLIISNPIISNEDCGQSDGAVDITVTGGDGNYTFAWSNSANTEDISSLSAGDYTITVTDGTSCSVSATFTVDNNTGAMAIDAASLTDETCVMDKVL